jgi:hypothetical protein
MSTEMVSSSSGSSSEIRPGSKRKLRNCVEKRDNICRLRRSRYMSWMENEDSKEHQGKNQKM